MKLWLIAKSNMRKKKGNVVILILLVALATVLLYTSVSTLKNMSSVIDDKNKSQNGAHDCLILTDKYQEEIESILRKDPLFKKLETENVVSIRGTNDIRNITKKLKKETMGMIFSDISIKRNISDLDIIDKGKSLTINSIVLPMYLKVANGYETGDEISVSFGNREIKFIVYGFTENVLFSTPSSISLYKCMISTEMMEKISKEDHMQKFRQYNVLLKDINKSADYEDAITKKIYEKIKDPSFLNVCIVNYTLMKNGSSIFVSLLMAVLAAFSIMIIMIALLVIKFSITSNMEDNLPNIGISEALGYTSGQLTIGALLEYMIITITGLIVGFIMAVTASGYVAVIISSSIGLIWYPVTDDVVVILTIALIMVLVLGIVLIMSKRYKKITPLDALRVGITTHNFKKNQLPLKKWNFGLQNALGIKTILHNKKQSISIIVIVMFLVYTCVLSMALYYNFIGDSSSLVNLVGIEKPNIQIVYTNDGTDAEGSVISKEAVKLERRPEVSKVNMVGNSVVTLYNDNLELSVETDIYENVSKLTIDSLIEGRRPKHDNEINITNVIADKFGISLGDSISIKKAGANESYVVVGITQQISNMGIRIMMSLDAFQRLNPDYMPDTVFVYLNDGSDATVSEVKEISSYYEDDARFQVMNFDEMYQSVLKTFNTSLTALCAVFMSITVFVVILIIMLIIRMKIVKEKRSMGVYKAIGYTTKQLVWQTVMGISPVVSIGALLGAVTASLTVNKVFVLMLSFCKIENADLVINPVMVTVCFVTVTILAFVAAALSALGVRKIEPYKMIVEG